MQVKILVFLRAEQPIFFQRNSSWKDSNGLAGWGGLQRDSQGQRRRKKRRPRPKVEVGTLSWQGAVAHEWSYGMHTWFREDTNLLCLDQCQLWLQPCPLCPSSGRQYGALGGALRSPSSLWVKLVLSVFLWLEPLEVLLKHTPTGHLVLCLQVEQRPGGRTRQKLFFKVIQDEELEYNHYFFGSFLQKNSNYFFLIFQICQNIKKTEDLDRCLNFLVKSNYF